MKLKNVLNPLYIFERRALIKPALKDKFEHYSNYILHLFRSHGVPLTINDCNVAAFKNKHLGQRCFIIGNGPSLKIGDLDRLKDEVTFASNKIYLAFDQTGWRPTYYSVYDVLVAENNKAAISKLKLCKIFGECIKPFVKPTENIVWIRELERPLLNGEELCLFSPNALEGVFGGWTVIYLQMQLAFYMGIREMYLIGVDFSFNVPMSTGKMCPSGEVLVHQGEINHFHPEYRMPGETWTMPLLDLQCKAFLAAQSALEEDGGSIFNASRKTALDVFPCVDFDGLFN